MFKSAVRTLALLAATPLLLVPTAAHADGAAALRPVPAETLMSELVTMTNQQRHAAGCGQLAVDQDLIVASLRQSSYMAQTGDFGHIGWRGAGFERRVRAVGYTQPAGENIAWGYATAPDVITAWMASPAHRANILNCGARSIGTGVTYAADGTPYFTQEFGWL